MLNIDKLPHVAPPRTELAYLAVVDLGDGVTLGRGPLGERRIVPIVGGRFEGPGLRGSVLRGGADRQLIRPSVSAQFQLSFPSLSPWMPSSSPPKAK
jgi:hypothetical protein